MHLKLLSPKYEKWLQWNERLHKLAKRGMLPKSLASLNLKPLYPSCTFSASRRKAGHEKNNYSKIRKPSYNFPGLLVSVDQLVSAHPGLVLQSLAYLSASRIWACAVLIDSFSSCSFGFMMWNTSLK